MSRTNETRLLNGMKLVNVNVDQIQVFVIINNVDKKCRCKCKELIDKGFIWNHSNCEYECDKSCDVGECLDNKNCVCRKNQLIDQLKNAVKILMEIE